MKAKLSKSLTATMNPTGGRKTRCTDKFVRYPYPKTMNTGYKKDFKDALKSHLVLVKSEAFNLEKEAKIINPHKMEIKTMNQTAFTGEQVDKKKKEVRKYIDERKPILGHSSYAKNFPNWQNGNKDVFHEKEPQYPFYSLPFKG